MSRRPRCCAGVSCAVCRVEVRGLFVLLAHRASASARELADVLGLEKIHVLEMLAWLVARDLVVRMVAAAGTKSEDVRWFARARAGARGQAGNMFDRKVAA